MTWNRTIYGCNAARPWPRATARLGVVASLLLTACATAERPGRPADAAVVPEAAIAVGPDLYMVPMGADSSGCPVFQPWSPTLMVVQALHWRTKNGDFTLDREAADCPPPDIVPQNRSR